MKVKRLFGSMVAGVALSAMLAGSVAAENITAAKDIANKASDAVVKISVVIKASMSIMGQSQTDEHKVEVNGTIIDPSGLTAASLSLLETGQLLDQAVEGLGKLTVSAEITDVKIITKDGTEIPAKIVLRDKDLDLAFVRPVQKPASMPYVSLAEASKADELDEVVVLSRLGKIAGRSRSISFARVDSVIEKPRKMYTLDTAGPEVLGSPVFTEDGKLIGLMLTKRSPDDSAAKASQSGMSMMIQAGSMSEGFLAVLPADTIATVAAKASQQ